MLFFISPIPLSFSLPSLFTSSLFPSCLYLFLPFHLSSLIFLGLYIFFHLFLSGSLLSLIPESLYPSIIHLFIHPSFFLPFYLQTFLRTFSLSYPFPFCLSLVPTFILCTPNLRQLLFEYEGAAPCLQKCFTVRVSSVITEHFLKLIMPVSCRVHSHLIFLQRNTKCRSLDSLIMHFKICRNSCKVSVVILWNYLNKTFNNWYRTEENYLLLRNLKTHNCHCLLDLFKYFQSFSTL